MTDPENNKLVPTGSIVPGVPDAEKPELGRLPDETIVGFASAASFALLQRIGTMLAASSLVPARYQKNVPNCIVAANMAVRMKCDVLMVMQNLNVVYNTPTWSAQFLIATFNMNPGFTNLRYKFVGEKGKDTYGCYAYATEKETGEILEGATVTVSIAKAEGWYDRKASAEKGGGAASKWPTMTQQMLMYRSASWFIRAYAPEIAMGFLTAEELEDIVPVAVARNITDSSRLLEKVGEAAEAAGSGLDALVAAEQAKKDAEKEAAAAAAAAGTVDGTITDQNPPAGTTAGPEEEKPAAEAKPGDNPAYATGHDKDPVLERNLFKNRK